MKGIITGAGIMIAGLVIMILGSMWGLVLLFGGLTFMALSYVTMMRGQGYDPDQGTINGLKGQGKQRSDAIKSNVPDIGEKSPAIWDTITGNKE